MNWKKINKHTILLLLIALSITTDSSATTRRWKFGLTTHVTRCFETKNIKFHCEDFAGKDEKIVREELQIEASNAQSKKYIYIYGKAIEGNLCREHLKKIKLLLTSSNQACITGDGELFDDQKEVITRWVSLECRNGEVLR